MMCFRQFHDKYNDDEDISKISSTLSKDKIGFVDLRERFKSEYKNGSQLYYKTDHHWTTKGAYTGYQELCKALGITPIDDSTLKKTATPTFTAQHILQAVFGSLRPIISKFGITLKIPTGISP